MTDNMITLYISKKQEPPEVSVDVSRREVCINDGNRIAVIDLEEFRKIILVCNVFFETAEMQKRLNL